jgi:A/G-specific adenine glycosylase
MDFKTEIIDWYTVHKRDLPWRKTKDPYQIWMSEIIFQQTRIDQGMAYFLKFIDHYPTIFDLAKASEDEVLKDWQGLGYYSRARNLHFTAKHVVSELDGVFPTAYEDILQLKGIGEYTASAIASFCYGAPHAVVDGNVYRVLSRVFGISTPIDSTIGKKEFKLLANELLSKKDPAIYNQSIMEFGALQCKPVSPDCTICPLNNACIALATAKIKSLPVKEKKIKQRKRFFDYFLIIDNDQVVVNQRREKDIWQHLYDFPLIENNKQQSSEQIIDQLKDKLGVPFTVKSESGLIKHILSHQILTVRFWQIAAPHSFILNENEQVVNLENIQELAFPKVVENYLELL